MMRSSRGFARLSLKKEKAYYGQKDLRFIFQKKLESQGMLKHGDRLWVACSGGPDSVALLHLLRGLPPPYRLRLGVIHFDHGLRGRKSSADCAFVRRLARSMKIPFYSAKASGLRQRAKAEKQSLEEAAREERYAFFSKAAKKEGVRKIASGHTLDDQAETVLMRLIRGTGLRGLAGIRRTVKMKGVIFVRPLMDFTKTQILEWLTREKIAFRMDASNDSSVYERNKIRHLFLPWLKQEIHPRVVETLARVADAAEDENQLMTALEESAWKQLKAVHRGSRLALRRKSFQAAHPALQFRLLDRALKQVNPASGLDFETWQTLRRSLTTLKGRCSLSRGLDLTFTPSLMVITNPQ